MDISSISQCINALTTSDKDRMYILCFGGFQIKELLIDKQMFNFIFNYFLYFQVDNYDYDMKSEWFVYFTTADENDEHF